MALLRVTLVLFLVYFITLFNSASLKDRKTKHDFELITVATNQTDGFNRFIRSAKVYNVPVKVLGLGEKWKGGYVRKYAGGGQKVNLLKQELEKYKDNAGKIVMFTDSYDVMLLAGKEKILEQFERFDARVVFSAEGFCWPDESLASQYPSVQRGKRYLNSGADVELRFRGPEAYLQNIAYNTMPLVVHGNGPSKLVLNTFGNYLANSWNSEDGCLSCWDDTFPLEDKDPASYPVVLIAVFIEQATPFLEEFFQKIYKLEYPKEKLHLFVHNAIEYHQKLVEDFISNHGEEYRSLKTIGSQDMMKEWRARSLAMDYCIAKNCEYYLNVDSEAHLDNPHALRLLIEQNRTIVAPLLLRPYKAWSNFWGGLTSDGFYARSMDYMEIIHNERRGVWNVPYVTACYLVNSSLLLHPETKPSYKHDKLDPDMAFCADMREKDVFMYVSNRIDFGHLVNPDNFDTSRTNSDLYQIFDNRWDWEQRYIHENYTENFNPNNTAAQPCPDVYWFPILTPRFCKEFIEIMEAFGQWSDGTNRDPRLDGGYENVPTRDIHMKQVGLEPHWLEVLRLYVRPLQELIFTGYFHDPPRAIMNFVVRYKPDEQPSLRPHHDSSTYTINLALNRPKIDYEGGGCKFIRYNCSVTDTKLGWMLMHPGRLTHYHEGLPVTKGIRYIMISFVDP